MLGLHFDGSVTLGDLMTVIGFVAAMAGMYIRLSVRLALVELKVGEIWTAFMGEKH